MQLAFAPLAAPGGYLAVDLFFMMSGVVISHAYDRRFRAGMGTVDFMRARLIRLYPLYLLGTLFGIAVTVASMHGHNIQNWDAASLLQAVWRALLLVPNFSTTPVNELFPLDIPCWSLFLEILVNLLFGIVWPLLTAGRLIGVCLVAGGVVAYAIVQVGNIDQGWIAASFVAGLARAVFGFCVGVLIARHIPHAPRRASNLKVLAIVAVVIIAVTGWPEGAARAFWDAICVLLVFPLVVYFGTRIDPDSRLRSSATFLGVTSYAVYVLHNPLTSVLNSVSKGFAGAAGVGAGAPYLGFAVLAVLLAGCWLVDRYFDMPIRQALGRIVPRMQALRAHS